MDADMEKNLILIDSAKGKGLEILVPKIIASPGFKFGEFLQKTNVQAVSL